MDSAFDTYLDFLRFSLHEDAAEPASLAQMDWDGLLNFGVEQAIVGVLYHGLLRLANSPYRPDKYKVIQWYAENGRLTEDNRKVFRDASRLTYHLYKHYGTKSVVLKGQANALMYPDPFMRTSGDIDLWAVTPDDDGKLHYWTVGPNTRRIIAIARDMDPQAGVEYHHVDVSVMSTPVEIHYFPSFMGNLCDERRLRRWFEDHKAEQFRQLVTLPEKLGRICVPTNAFNRVFQMSHLMHHFFFEGIGFRQMIDYYYLLRQGFTEEERQETLRVMRRIHMLRFTRAVMYLMRDTFGLEEQYLLVEPDTKAGRLLLSEVLKSGNFGHYDDRYNFKGLPLWKQYLLEIYRNLHYALYFPSETIWGRPVSRWWHMIYKRMLRR